MRHSVDGKYNSVPNTKEARAGANEDRSVTILNDAGDELRLEQVRLPLWIDLTGGKVEDTRIRADPKTSAAVWKDRADGVARRLDTKQVVMKGMAVITVDAVEPGAIQMCPRRSSVSARIGVAIGIPGGLAAIRCPSCLRKRPLPQVPSHRSP